jgi:hypothetical protein
VNYIWIRIVLLFCFGTLISRTVSAQEAENDPETRRAAAAQAAREVAAQKAINDEMRRGQQNLSEFLRVNNPTLTSNRPGILSSIQRFQMAIPKFRDATNQYREVMGLDHNLRKPLQTMRTQIDVMLQTLKSSRLKHAGPDTSAFKTYSKTELEWEALTSAEQTAASLDRVATFLTQEVVSVKTQEFLYEFLGQLLRLRWLTTHVDPAPSPQSR